MSFPVNIFTNFLALTDVLSADDLYETRLDNNSTGSVLFIGKNITPFASTSANTWYIKKLSYDSNGFVDRVQLPNEGAGFLYNWDNRASYFA